MLKRNTRNSGLALIALLLAGCGGGGGGSDDTAVSANPSAPTAAEPAPAPSPAQTPLTVIPGQVADETGSTPAPAPAGPSPAPSGPSPAPAGPSPAPAPAASVPGMLVWADLVRGVSPDPAPDNPRTDYRKVAMQDGSFIYLGGALESHSFATAPWGGVIVEGLVSVSVVGSNGVIDGVRANNMTLSGPQLDLRNVNPLIDRVAGRWTNGEWFAQLIIQSGSSADRVRACWNVNLPPPPTAQGPGGQAVVYTVPLKRLMCGEYSKTTPGQDVGGYVVDDFNGQIRTFRGSW